jgi:hypothetical protein
VITITFDRIKGTGYFIEIKGDNNLSFGKINAYINSFITNKDLIVKMGD